jgi:PAS domain S-box-containing protein
MVYVVIGMFTGLFGWSIIRKKYMLPNNVNAISDMLSQEKFKSTVILESITDGVLVLNIKGTVQIMNESAASMLGWTREEALHLDYRSLITPDSTTAPSGEPEKTAIDICLQTQKPAHKMSLIESRGNRSYIDIVASPIYQTKKNDDGTVEQISIGAIAVLRNVDEQKRQEEQRSDFISTASHEMRTPVASIQGFIELALNSKVATIDAKARGYLEKAHEATKHLGSLFQDLLTVSRSDDGRLTNNPKLIEVGEFLKKTVEQARVAAEKKNLKISVESNNLTDSKVIAPLLYVNVDPDRLREVILNLLDNAIKYTSAGIITVGTSLKEQGVLIRVSDTGMGIPAEDIPHLFQKFYRTDNSVTREIGGTGLGLYICKRIVEMMSGKIWVESTVGAGSTFYVELPRISPEKIAAINMAANPNPAAIKSQEV